MNSNITFSATKTTAFTIEKILPMIVEHLREAISSEHFHYPRYFYKYPKRGNLVATTVAINIYSNLTTDSGPFQVSGIISNVVNKKMPYVMVET